MTQNSNCAPLKAPFPWFGGKSRAAHLIWPRLGCVPNYVEPFAGSLAVLLRRPHAPGNEIVNDLDCYVANAWRAMKLAPQQVAQFCDWPVNEADLHARHRWLHGRAEFRLRMEHEPDFFDARIAGYWIWGLSCWIGDNFCRPKPQNSLPKIQCEKVVNVHRKIHYLKSGQGVSQQTLGGQGVARKVPHLTGGKGGSAESAASDGLKWPEGSQGVRPGYNARCGVHSKSARATASTGIWRKRPECSHTKGSNQTENLIEWFDSIAARLRHTKVCCGDWARVLTKAATYGVGLTGVLMDPPYDPAAGLDKVYGDHHADDVSAKVREWALANGSNPLLRIALCGYEGEHTMPADWSCVAWKAAGGYGSAAGNDENSKRERIWFSPHCLNAAEMELFT